MRAGCRAALHVCVHAFGERWREGTWNVFPLAFFDFLFLPHPFVLLPAPAPPPSLLGGREAWPPFRFGIVFREHKKGNGLKRGRRLSGPRLVRTPWRRDFDTLPAAGPVWTQGRKEDTAAAGRGGEERAGQGRTKPVLTRTHARARTRTHARPTTSQYTRAHTQVEDECFLEHAHASFEFALSREPEEGFHFFGKVVGHVHVCVFVCA